MPDTPVPRPEVVAWLQSGAERHERYVADGIEWSNEGNAHRLAALYRAALRDVEAMGALEAKVQRLRRRLTENGAGANGASWAPDTATVHLEWWDTHHLPAGQRAYLCPLSELRDLAAAAPPGAEP